MKVSILRLIKDNEEEINIGVLYIQSKLFCTTLEKPYKDNKKNISCIPEGIYICKRKYSVKYGETFEIKDVPNRTNILFHVGNYNKDTKGCVLLGEGFRYRNKPHERDRMITNSREKIKEFMSVMKNYDEFVLHITNLSELFKQFFYTRA